MHKLIFAILYLFVGVLTLSPEIAHAQITQPGVRQNGAVTNGDLTTWQSNGVIQDGGSKAAIFSAITNCTDQGAVAYIDSGGEIACLSPGTTGQFLTTQGAASDPIWSAGGAGTGTVTSVGFAAGAGLGFSGTNPVTTNNTGTEATFSIATNGVTFALMQTIATNSLLGRDTAGTGNVENIALNSTLEMDGLGNLQRAALAGDTTAAAGSNTTVTSAVNGVAYPASPSDDQIPVADSSSAATYRTVPDCTDASGNHLNYTQSTNSFSCGTSQARQGFVGQIIWMGGTSCPSGTLAVDGSTPSQATYPALYAYLGTTWGSDAGGNFTLPDFVTSNRFIRAAGGLLAVGTTQAHQLQEHTHTQLGTRVSNTTTGGSGDRDLFTGSTSFNETLSSGTTGNYGTETRPNNGVALACIVY